MNARFLLLVVILIAFVIELQSALGQQPAQPEKTVKFTMEGKTWRDVFEWLTEVTGKPVISTYQPTGKFPCMDLLRKEYTIPEVIDIINEALQSDDFTQKYILINRARSFTLVPADERIDRLLLPSVRSEDLKKYGNTELVSIVFPLKSLDAEFVAPRIKKVMGRFGDVVAMRHIGVNQLVMMDTVANLKRVCKMLEEGRLPAEPPPDLRRRTDPRFGDDPQFGMK